MKKKDISSQSKKWLVDAFFDLLYIKPFFDISISEIAENAQLDRRTFYRHFKSKDEVLRYYILEVAKQYEKIMEDNGRQCIT